ncbi:uncharacterized protein [Porites lutea]|uniref:uncharacterized protein n=1 Tax=Porites lutea TaxID=51062 RepID=UPI003CC5ED90
MTGEDLFKFSQHLIQQMLGQTNGLGFLKAQLRKINEVGHRPIHGFFCGDQTTEIYLAVCYGYHYDESKTHRSVMVDEKEANNFLHRLRRSSSSTNIVEECCIEGCHMEEVREYC